MERDIYKNQLDVITKLVVDIAMTIEVMEDYIVNKNHQQTKIHFYHIKSEFTKLLLKLISTEIKEPK